MAQSSQPSLAARISLIGGDAVKALLKEIGSVADATFRGFNGTINDANAKLGGLSTVSTRLQAGFFAVGSTVRGVRDGFNEVDAAAQHFRTTAVEFGERIFPHFREVAALATGAGIAGFIALAREAARSATELDIVSHELGIPTQRLQGLAGAANAVGVETGQLYDGLLRLSRQITQVAIQQRDGVLEITAQATQGISAQGIVVLRGMQTASNDALTVLRGNAKGTSTVISNIEQNFRAVLPLAIRARDEALDAAKRSGVPLNLIPQVAQLQAMFAKLLETDDKFRQQARDIGVLAPFKTLPELLLDARDAGNDLGKMFKQLGIPLVDLATGKKKALDEALIDFAKNFNTAADRGKAAYQAFKLFGDNYERILPILARGGDDLNKTAAAIVKLGLGFTLLDIKAGRELNESFSRLETAAKGAANVIVLALAPVIQPVLDGLTNFIKDNAFQIRDLAASIANELLPVAKDLLLVLSGQRDQVQTESFKVLLGIFDALKLGATGVAVAFRVAFTGISYLLTPLALLLNFLFGTSIQADALAYLFLIGQLTGGFTLLVAALNLAFAPLKAFYGLLLGAAALVGWPLVILAGLVALGGYLLILNDNWKTIYGTMQGVGDIFRAIGDYLGPLGLGFRVLGDLIKLDFAQAFFDLVKPIQTIIYWLGYLIGVAADAVKALGRVLGLTGTPAPDVPVPGPGFREGGAVRGRGTSTSDSILSWLSNGEFVIKAAAVRRYGLAALQAINNMSFADGGYVDFLGIAPRSTAATLGAGADRIEGRVAVDLTDNGTTFNGLLAPKTVAERMVKYAQNKASRSLGKRPTRSFT